MKKKFDILAPVLSAVFGFLGVEAAYLIFKTFRTGTVMSNVVLAVVYFLLPMVMGFLGLQLALLINRKKFKTAGGPGVWIRMIAVLVVMAILGGAAQLLYCIEVQRYSTERVVENKAPGSNVIMLMDISGSMSNERDACVEAACSLVDGLDATTSMQFIAFESIVKPEYTSRFLSLDATNKQEIKTVIQNVNTKGGTNFNYPLEEAIKTLEDNHQKDFRSMIIMITDGREASVGQDVQNKLKNSSVGIEFFTLRVITAGEATTQHEKDLAALATKDFPLMQQTNGSLDVSTVAQTLQEAFNHKEIVIDWHEKLGMGSDMLFVQSEQSFWWRPVVSIVIFALYSVLLSVAYYGMPGILSLILSLATGALTGWMAETNATMALLPLVLLCLTAYTVYEIREGTQNV